MEEGKDNDDDHDRDLVNDDEHVEDDQHDNVYWYFLDTQNNHRERPASAWIPL